MRIHIFSKDSARPARWPPERLLSLKDGEKETLFWHSCGHFCHCYTCCHREHLEKLGYSHRTRGLCWPK